MARNGSGTMAIPNTFSPGDTVTSSGQNQNFTDIASEITNSLAIDGQSSLTGPLKAANGTAAAPALTFGTDTDTGIYRKAGNTIGIAAGGTEIASVDANGLIVTSLEATQKIILSGDITPSQITSDQNNFAPPGLATASVIRITTDTNRIFTGLAGGTDGRLIYIYNPGSNPATLKNESTLSDAANRFGFGEDFILLPKQGASLLYDADPTALRWRLVGSGSFMITAARLAGSSQGVTMINGTISESHSGNAVTFAIKTLAGSDPSSVDPVLVRFQNGTGGYVVRSVTSALSFTISSGSTMGFVSGVAGRLWHVLVDTGSGVVLGAVNCLSGISILALVDGITYSTTAEGGSGGADNAQVIFTAAAQTSKFICIAGYSDYDSGLATTGTWNVSPNRTVLFGPGVPRPGEYTGNYTRNASGAVATGTTGIPIDDTIPQNTEGDQYFTASISPSSPANLFEVSSFLNSSSSSANHQAMALFKDSGANALCTTVAHTPVSGATNQTTLRHVLQALSFTTAIFKIRAGGVSGGTYTLNGFASGRLFGGTEQSYLEVKEIMG